MASKSIDDYCQTLGSVFACVPKSRMAFALLTGFRGITGIPVTVILTVQRDTFGPVALRQYASLLSLMED